MLQGARDWLEGGGNIGGAHRSAWVAAYVCALPTTHSALHGPPGYYLRRARPSLSRFWHIHLPGGGWCTTEETCAWRAGRKLGSSRLWPRAMIPAWLPGIMSADPDVNPGFSEWNMVMAVYCDGGGYVGRRGEVTVAGNTTLHMDGWKIVMAILDDLSSKGLMAAQQVLITGESAGGQAVVNLCDYIAAYLSFATVKCLSDGGFFIDVPDRRGRSFFREIAENATQLHQMFNPKCNQDLPSQAQWRCFFPQYSLAYVTSDIFILNTLFDPIALMIGAQLPWGHEHAKECLFSLRWGASGGGGGGLSGGAGFWTGGAGIGGGGEGGRLGGGRGVLRGGVDGETAKPKMLGGDGGAVFTSVGMAESDYNEAFWGSGYSEAGSVGVNIAESSGSSNGSNGDRNEYANDPHDNIRVFLLNAYAHGIGGTSYWTSFTSDWMLMPLNIAVANWDRDAAQQHPTWTGSLDSLEQQPVQPGPGPKYEPHSETAFPGAPPHVNYFHYLPQVALSYRDPRAGAARDRQLPLARGRTVL
ncbi:unnamed protein product [Closterium sp. Yama58-4]|nr:unnamed protein product [Closterium sp. Yama58-4]